jgi:amino acid transporter
LPPACELAKRESGFLPDFDGANFMDSPDPSAEPIRPQLGLWDTVSIIIGIVIGAGIYETVPAVFKNVPNGWSALGVWVLGGVLSFIGALCYAELASAYPRSGGDYVYLTRAFGPWMGFLFGWAQLVVIRAGNIGMMGYVFGDYAVALFGLPEAPTKDVQETSQQWSMACAAGAVTVLSVLNLLGVTFGKRTQNLLTLAKVLGLGGILAAGFFAPKAGPAALTEKGPVQVSVGLAMVFVLYTFGGWNDAALVAAEQRNRRRNITLSLILGTCAITLIYVLINTAYLFSLGFEGVRNSKAVAADVLGQFQGVNASRIMSILVMVSALGAINGMVFTGSRIYAALGNEYRLFAWLGRWNPRLGSPFGSIVTQWLLTVGLILLVGSRLGRGQINIGLEKVGLKAVEWEGHGGFDTLLKCTAPSFWLFFLLTGLSLFVLRERDKDIERPFRVPFYPLLPLFFCDTCAYMLYSSTDYAKELVLPVLVLLHVGIVVYWISRPPARQAIR